MKLGEIYKTEFDERVFRIIGLDNYEVFYDCLSNENKWTFSGNFKRKSIFFRMGVELFKIKSELIKREEFTEKEAEYFRADLPMRFGRIKDLSWEFAVKSELNKYQNEFSQRKVNAEKIILIPSGAKGGFLKGELIESNSILTEFEIIQKASELQKLSSNGIGFYRLGCQKGIPTYLIGEYLDKAGIMK
ncbi:hypothetical protein [uncultured Polaribacter sp.]|uniref:hypothetical protein n=1 Tax=uncultured Polaribacter sp. TaxID=174711 RepID=UPI0026075F27|nr:hypothetical protein [uncultured Polaribacter sp.]